MAIFGKKEENSKAKAEEKDVQKASKEKKVSSKGKTDVKDAKKNVKKSTEDKKKSVVKKNIQQNSNAYKILVKPLITEKSAIIAKEGKYVFEVNVNANKIEIAKSIYEVYGIKPVNVNIMNFNGKKVTRGRFVGKRKDWKKAIVTLAKGEKIDLYKGV